MPRKSRSTCTGLYIQPAGDQRFTDDEIAKTKEQFKIKCRLAAAPFEPGMNSLKDAVGKTISSVVEEGFYTNSTMHTDCRVTFTDGTVLVINGYDWGLTYQDETPDSVKETT